MFVAFEWAKGSQGLEGGHLPKGAPGALLL
jgi:hypothetical protein